MKYKDIISNAPTKSEKTMWDSVDAVSELLETIEESHPDIAKRFKMKEYARLYGGHFCKEMAESVVADMFHVSRGVEVRGEMATQSECMSVLDSDERERLMWDAYVGVNGFLHDLANTGMSKNDIMQVAGEFWFCDDDYDGDSKVLWYYSNM